MPYLSTSAIVIHYEEELYQVYAPLPFTYTGSTATLREISIQVTLYRSLGGVFTADAKLTPALKRCVQT